MGRKKKKREDEQKPWCWYCDREFIDEPTLVQHQKNKHFKCGDCHRKLNTAQGLCVHAYQVHKVTVSEIPGALPGREGVDREIFGMAGVPKGAKPGQPWGDEGEPSSKKAKSDTAAQQPPAAPMGSDMGSMGLSNGMVGAGHMGMGGPSPMGPAGMAGPGMGSGHMGMGGLGHMGPGGPMGMPGGPMGMGGPMGGPPAPHGMGLGGPGPMGGPGGYMGPPPPPRPGMMGGPMGPLGAPPGMGGPPMPPPRPGYGPPPAGFSGPPPPMRGPPHLGGPGPGPMDRINGAPGDYPDGGMGGPGPLGGQLGMRPPGGPLFPIGQQGPPSGGAPGSSGPSSGPGQPLFPVMGPGPSGPALPGGPGMTGPSAAALESAAGAPGDMRQSQQPQQQQQPVPDNMKLVWSDERYSMEERRAMLPKYAAARGRAAQQKEGAMGFQTHQPGMVHG